jgi:hypothetical protein
MKKFTQIVVTIVVFLVTQTIAFAQLPNDFGATSNNGDANPNDVPIDSNLWLLLLVGLLYVFYKYGKLKQVFNRPIKSK